MASALNLPRFRYTVTATDANGNSYLAPASGYLLNIYNAGTTTRLTTYSDSALTVANANPLTLDADGAATVYFTVPAKVDLTNAAGTSVAGYPVDDINPSLAASSTAATSTGIVNGNFETLLATDATKPETWTVAESITGTIVIDTTDQTTGNNSLQFTGADINGAGTITSNKFYVTSSSTVLTTFSYKSSAADTRNIAQLKFYNAAGGTVSTSSIMDEGAANPTSFALRDYMTAVPSTVVQAEFIFQGMVGSGTTVAGTTNLDSVSVIQNNFMPTTNGTGQADKAVVLDSSRDIANLNVVTAASFIGPLTGNVTGDVTGDLLASNAGIAVTTVAVTSSVNALEVRPAATGNPVRLQGTEAGSGMDLAGNGSDVTIDGIPIYGLVILDTPVVLVSLQNGAIPTTNTSVNSSVLNAALAKKAILQVRLTVSTAVNSVAADIFIGSSNSISATSPYLKVGVRGDADASVTTVGIENDSEVTVNLDSNYDFWYRGLGTGNATTTLNIYLVGYYT